MNAKEFAETVVKDNNRLIGKINNALIDVNGRKFLPLWIEDFSNGRLENLSADALQGMKIVLLFTIWRMNEFIEDEEKEEENDK